jgi:two-component system, OmpR family, sensor histidine kinase BaeS
MRTKLFLAFFTVILTALVSNLIFENFISRDFEDYVSGTKEDRLYWILASVEGSYSGGRWQIQELHEAVQWAIMLGFDMQVTDMAGKVVITSGGVLGMLSPSMRKRMEESVDIRSATGRYVPYPLYREGTEIGTLLVRSLKRIGSISEKETTFEKRGREFLVTSFAIAGGGAVFLAVFFSLFLSRPLKRMKEAVEHLAQGDLGVRVPVGSKKDEVGRLAESFNFMAEALQREEALRKHLTSNIAHELRTPLAIMKANVEAMVDGIVKSPEEGLANIQMEVERLIDLVEGIEDITKAEASFFAEKKYAEIDLPEFLSMVAAKLMPLAFEKGLRIKIVTNRMVKVFSDPDKLERIIQNIVTNSIKNTKSGGIWIDYGTEKEMFFVEIRDSGRGIPEDKLGMVFKRFYRGEESEGIGLGLAIVKELVDVMGGRVELKSKVGEGTVFTTWLPREA